MKCDGVQCGSSVRSFSSRSWGRFVGGRAALGRNGDVQVAECGVRVLMRWQPPRGRTEHEPCGDGQL